MPRTVVSDDVTHSNTSVMGVPPAVTLTERGTVSPTFTTSGPVYAIETSPILAALKRSARPQPKSANPMPTTGILCRNRIDRPPPGTGGGRGRGRTPPRPNHLGTGHKVRILNR